MGAKTNIPSVMSDLIYMLGKCLCPALKSKGWSQSSLLGSAESGSPRGESLPQLPAPAPCIQEPHSQRHAPPWPPGHVAHLPAGLAWCWPGPRTDSTPSSCPVLAPWAHRTPTPGPPLALSPPIHTRTQPREPCTQENH